MVRRMKMKLVSMFFTAVLLLVVAIPAGAAADTTGGDQGWYVIHCNAYGAKVYLDDKYVGTTEQGTLTVPASTTGTPYKVIRVQEYGYSTFTDVITQVPGKGMMVDLFATLNPLPSTSPTSIGGDVGWYVVHCNIDGATVLFDTVNRGEISQGTLYVPVYSTGTPYKTLTVQKDGYTPYTTNVPRVPGKGEAIDFFATLNPVATPTVNPVILGGDTGWYKIHCNVDGATVSFNNEEKGQIFNGSVMVKVYVTGTPYRTFTVYKAGYIPYSGSIDQYPKKDETVDLFATMGAQPVTPTPVTTTKSSLPPEITGLALIICCMGMLAAARKR
jgi:hypothetical protein